MGSTSNPEVLNQLSYPAVAVRVPHISETAMRLGGEARDASWSQEDYFATKLKRKTPGRRGPESSLRA